MSLPYNVKTVKRTTPTDDRPHGYAMYARRECRCRVCRRGWAEYQRGRRRLLRGRKVTAERPAVFRHKQPHGMALTALEVEMLRVAERETGLSQDDLLVRGLRRLGVAGLVAADVLSG